MWTLDHENITERLYMRAGHAATRNFQKNKGNFVWFFVISTEQGLKSSSKSGENIILLSGDR